MYNAGLMCANWSNGQTVEVTGKKQLCKGEQLRLWVKGDTLHRWAKQDAPTAILSENNPFIDDVEESTN